MRLNEMNIEGIVIKGVAGFFDVLDNEGKIWQVKARGKLRHKSEELLVGDQVRCQIEQDRVMINEILPRLNRLQRPPVANVDQVVLVMSCSQPAPSWLLLDRLLLMAEQQRIRPVIFLNKADLVTQEQGESFAANFRHTGYPVILGSERTELGIALLREQICGHLSVFAGPSGAGKSSLLNCLHPEWKLATGDLSLKLHRGRHTTRQAQLLCLPEGGMVADTPGFYAFESEVVPSRQLAGLYPEMRFVLGQCRFGSSCLHLAEPDCAVKDLLTSGELSEQRYRNYVLLLQEMITKERKY